MITLFTVRIHIRRLLLFETTFTSNYLFTCFIVDLNQIKKQVDENEPGTTKYFMGTSREDPNEIWLWEEVSHFRLLIFTLLNMDKAC